MKHILLLMLGSALCFSQTETHYFPHLPNTDGIVQSSITVYNHNSSETRFTYNFYLSDGTYINENYTLSGYEWFYIQPEDIPPGSTAIVMPQLSENLDVTLSYKSDQFADKITMSPVKAYETHSFRIPEKRDGWLAAAIFKPASTPNYTVHSELRSERNGVFAEEFYDGMFDHSEKGLANFTDWLHNMPIGVKLDIISANPVAVTLLNGNACGSGSWDWTPVEPYRHTKRFLKFHLRGNFEDRISTFSVELEGNRLVYTEDGFQKVKYLLPAQLTRFLFDIRGEGLLSARMRDTDPVSNCTPMWHLDVDFAHLQGRNSFETDSCRLNIDNTDFVDEVESAIITLYEKVGDLVNTPVP